MDRCRGGGRGNERGGVGSKPKGVRGEGRWNDRLVWDRKERVYMARKGIREREMYGEGDLRQRDHRR